MATKAPRRSRKKKWVWTPEKKTAFRYLLDGQPQTEIAKKIGVHRHTIANWIASPEWLGALQSEQGERRMTSRLRRVSQVGRILDRLGKRAMKLMSKEQVNVSLLSVVLREFVSQSRLERELYGERPGSNLIDELVTSLGGSSPETPVSCVAPSTLLEAMNALPEDWRPELDEKLHGPAMGQAMFAALIASPDLLERIHQEDLEQDRREKTAKEEAKRWRKR